MPSDHGEPRDPEKFSFTLPESNPGSPPVVTIEVKYADASRDLMEFYGGPPIAVLTRFDSVGQEEEAGGYTHHALVSLLGRTVLTRHRRSNPVK